MERFNHFWKKISLLATGAWLCIGNEFFLNEGTKMIDEGRAVGGVHMNFSKANGDKSVSKFADNGNICGVVDRKDGCQKVQPEMDKL